MLHKNAMCVLPVNKNNAQYNREKKINQNSFSICKHYEEKKEYFIVLNYKLF